LLKNTSNSLFLLKEHYLDVTRSLHFLRFVFRRYKRRRTLYWRLRKVKRLKIKKNKKYRRFFQRLGKKV